MATKSKAIEPQKQEVEIVEGVERTRASRVYIPSASIYETSEEIVVTADIPGVDEKGIDLILEKNELTISGYVEPFEPEGYVRVYSEYAVGDYHRTFILPDEIDRDKISAVVKDGVLTIHLAKSPEALTRKIAVKAE
jgi:HSP20 family molecular chaperone IbpA